MADDTIRYDDVCLYHENSDKVKPIINWLEKNTSYTPSIVVCLEPPVPFRKAEHIDKCIESIMKNKEVTSPDKLSLASDG